MKRGWVASLLATVALIAWMNVSESRAAPEAVTVRLCYENVDVRPWHYRRGGGLDFQLLDRAAGTASVTFQYEAMPWQACLERLRANQVDGAFGEDFAMLPALGLGAGQRLHAGGQGATYLVLASEFAGRRPELVERIQESVETVRRSAAYQILERQTLFVLGDA